MKVFRFVFIPAVLTLCFFGTLLYFSNDSYYDFSYTNEGLYYNFHMSPPSLNPPMPVIKKRYDVDDNQPFF